jgi:hypothetical protein
LDVGEYFDGDSSADSVGNPLEAVGVCGAFPQGSLSSPWLDHGVFSVKLVPSDIVGLPWREGDACASLREISTGVTVEK